MSEALSTVTDGPYRERSPSSTVVTVSSSNRVAVLPCAALDKRMRLVSGGYSLYLSLSLSFSLRSRVLFSPPRSPSAFPRRQIFSTSRSTQSLFSNVFRVPTNRDLSRDNYSQCGRLRSIGWRASEVRKTLSVFLWARFEVKTKWWLKVSYTLDLGTGIKYWHLSMISRFSGNVQYVAPYVAFLVVKLRLRDSLRRKIIKSRLRKSSSSRGN